MSLEKCLQEIADADAALSYSSLIELSDPSPAELGRFGRVWLTVPSKRRVQIIERLVEMAENAPQLDFSAVFTLALKDLDETVQEKAISGLWEFEDRSIIPLLLAILQSDRPCGVRAAAATALGKFAHLAQDGKLLSQDSQGIQEALMAVLQDEGGVLEVRRRALEAVSPFNTPHIQQYINWAYKSDDLDLRCSSLYAMGRTQDRAWLHNIIPELQSTSVPLRYEATCACGELGEEDAVPHLISLIEDDDLEVQMAMITAMGKIGGPLAKRALLRCVRTGDESIREAAQEALDNMEV